MNTNAQSKNILNRIARCCLLLAGVGLAATTSLNAAVNSTAKRAGPASAIPMNGLVLWLDASDSSSLVLDGNEVREWWDRSGQGKHFVATEKGARPQLEKDSRNGLRMISFDGENQYFSGPAVLKEAQNSYTIIALWRPRQYGGMSVFEQGTPGVGGARGALLASGLKYGFCGQGHDCADLVPFKPDVWRVTSMSVDLGREQTVRISDNGTIYEGIPLNPQQLNLGTTGATIGRKQAAAGEYLKGEIAEILVYNRVLSQKEETTLLGSLCSKWGVEGATNPALINSTEIKPSAPKKEEAAAQREITIAHPYLHLPVKNGAPERRIRFVVDGKTVRDFMIELAEGAPDFQVFSDVSSFKGQKLRIEMDKAPNATALDKIVEADAVPGASEMYREKYRPQFHFSPRRGWTGDPNGLVYYKGEYHLFFQYNPYGVKFGNIQWGHAVSKDLVHWQELPIALYPFKYGDWPYSGGAVIDKANTAGFKQGQEDTLVAVYPSTGRGICIAYSTDGGRSLTQYPTNPLPLRNVGGDPRVVWHEATRQWVMLTSKRLVNVTPGTPDWLIKSKCGFDFFTSPDLKNWTWQSRIEDYWECPELFELPVDGDKAHTKWVVYSNATPSLCTGKHVGGRYVIGTFDGKRFTEETGKLQFNYGNAYGAAQSYNNIPAEDGRRINVGCAFGTRMPGMPFAQMMNFPTELTLRNTEEGPRLFALPVREIKSLYASTRKMDNVALTAEGTALPGVEGDLFDISAEFAVGAETEEVGLKIRGVPVTFNARAGQLICGDRTAPLKPVDGKITLRVLVDRVSLEIFANEGRVYMPMAVIPKDEERSIAVFAKGTGAKVTDMTVNALKSAWER